MKNSLSDIKLTQIKSVDEPPFFYLLQFYEFEFSPITNCDTDENGLYDYKKLQTTWHHNYDAYLFYLDKLPIGLAVVNLSSKLDNSPNTRDIAEFFVMPNYRSYGIGELMATQLFDKYPGQWEVRQLHKAGKARKFWLQVINKYTKGNYTELECNNQLWHGYVQRFLSSVK
jgi:predicted acetyltransferase